MTPDEARRRLSASRSSTRSQRSALGRDRDAQTVQRGTKVTLDGSLSIGAASYRWEQIPNVDGQVIPADHVVKLSSSTAVKPTFTFPLMALPTAPGPNNAYTTVAATPLRFRLTVTGVDGTTVSSAETVVRPVVENLTVAETPLPHPR